MVRLDHVIAELDVVAVQGDPTTVDVGSVTLDSTRVRSGSLFCCVPGRRVDGHDFALEAVGAGAVALLCEHPLDLDVAQVQVADARAQAGRAAAAVLGHPSRRLQVVGVTGTNGKTTTAVLLHAVLEAAGLRTGLIGTLSGRHTTPEAPDLQERLARLDEDGAVAVAVEVSSHALALGRVEGTWFSLAVFTNLGHDHLDFHPSMEDYFAAKARLFEPERSGAAVVNADDPYGRRLLEGARIPMRPYSLADVSDLCLERSSSHGRWQGEQLQVPLGGRANVANALAAATAALELGVDRDTVIEALASAPPVPGRFEEIDAGQPFGVVVDYAHTREGMEHVLGAVREVAGGGRVLVVFGCGGDRDRRKRPAMGQAAARLADLVVVTSDNPRSEDPDVIIAEVVAGAGAAANVVVVADRRAAIATALDDACPGDVVVVAGKGHETTQSGRGAVVPFDDRVVVREELARLGLGGRGGAPG